MDRHVIDPVSGDFPLSAAGLIISFHSRGRTRVSDGYPKKLYHFTKNFWQNLFMRAVYGFT